MANTPHGGILKDLLARDEPIKEKLAEEAHGLKEIVLTERQLCDLELTMNGGFSPLEGFMNEGDYNSVVETLRLADGTLFPIPVTLDVSREDIDRLGITPGARLALRDPRDDEALAILTVEDVYQPDLVKEAINVFGADDPAHPSVAYLRNRVKEFYVGGKVQAIQAPTYFDYVALRYTHPRVMIYVPRFGQPDNGMDQHVGLALAGCSHGQFAMGAMHRVASLECYNLSPGQLFEMSAKL